MICKKSIIILGIAGIASFIIGGCGLGVNSLNDSTVCGHLCFPETSL